MNIICDDYQWCKNTYLRLKSPLGVCVAQQLQLVVAAWIPAPLLIGLLHQQMRWSPHHPTTSLWISCITNNSVSNTCLMATSLPE
jgi:hypothetical protein